MAVNINTYSDISSFVNTIYEDALLIARENNIMPGLVRTFNDRQGMAVRNVSKYGTVTINSVGESDDMTSQAFTPSSLANLTPAELGAQYLMTDQRLETDPFGVREDAVMDLGMAMATQIDSDLLGNFNALTAGTIGASGSVMTWNYFFAMMTTLKRNYAPMPYVAVFTPNQFYRLAVAVGAGATVTNAPALQDKFSTSFYQGNFYGVDVFISAACETSSTDAYAGMWSRNAIAFDVRRAPRLEWERDASRRAWELNLTAVYAHGAWRGEWGVCGLFANSNVDGT